jgi:hypothetical protein
MEFGIVSGMNEVYVLYSEEEINLFTASRLPGFNAQDFKDSTMKLVQDGKRYTVDVRENANPELLEEIEKHEERYRQWLEILVYLVRTGKIVLDANECYVIASDIIDAVGEKYIILSNLAAEGGTLMRENYGIYSRPNLQATSRALEAYMCDINEWKKDHKRKLFCIVDLYGLSHLDDMGWHVYDADDDEEVVLRSNMGNLAAKILKCMME